MNSLVSMIGTVFVDMKGMSFAAVKKDARNLGKISVSHGGSSRNAAENLVKMGQKCLFFSTVSNDDLGSEVIQKLKNAGAETEYLFPCPDGMGMWLAVIDNRGDLAASISQLPDLQHLERYIDQHIEEVVLKSKGVAMDVDLTYNITSKVIDVCRKHNRPLYGVVGNLDVVSHYPQILQGLECFVCNKEEAELLLKCKINTVDEAKEAVKRIGDLGPKSAVVTLDAGGSVYYDSGSAECGYYPTKEVKLVDSTGAGDAFFSGVVYELVQGHNLKQAVARGTQIALQVIQSKENNLAWPIEINELLLV